MDALGSDAAIGAKDATPRERARLLLQYEPKKVAAVRQVRVGQETRSCRLIRSCLTHIIVRTAESARGKQRGRASEALR
jgi:hypothetical protein